MGISKGDVLRLRSGGPLLTVQDASSGAVKCCWFTADGVFQEATFAAESFVRAGNFCSSCHRPIGDEKSICPSCGKPIDEQGHCG
jgi:uncharacterized protein YodC (DUF2158 family)